MSVQQQLAYYQHKLAYETDSADLFHAINSGERIVVVDGRSVEAYRREHIPGAINLPHRTITAESVRHLDRTVRYVAYCDGIGCNGSTKTALKLAELGLPVKELIGGLDWWKRDGYATLGELAQDGAPVSCGC